MINLNQFVTNLLSLLIFFILLFVYTKLAGPIPFDITQVTTTKADAFTVTGEGKASVKADFASVVVGVSERGATAQEAQDKMNQSINQVIEAIKALGIDGKNIKTDNYNVYESFDPGRPVLAPEDKTNLLATKIYQGNTNITIKVDKPDLANKVLDTAVSKGANNVSGVQFETKDKNVALNKARELAVADAKIKAQDAARIAGFKLGKIINYSENEGGGYPIPMMAKAESVNRDSAPTQVQPGENEIVVTVNLSYEIR